jgi:pilus assembly protein CpaC
MNAGLAWDAGALGRMTRPGESVIETAGPVSAAAGYFGVNALLSARIAALAQTGEAVMLAQPQLLARSGASATFLAGGEVPYVSTDGRGNPTTLFKPYGVSLSITPRIDRNGVIRSLIEVEASSVDSSLSVAGGPALRTRRASTEFNVRSGNTLVIGGFLSRENAEEVSGLPWLQNIPILGALFSSRRYQQRETELAIFVTPKIVSQSEPALAERVRRGREVLDATFPEPPRLGTAVPSVAGGWDPYSGAGSQWTSRDDTTRTFLRE